MRTITSILLFAFLFAVDLRADEQTRSNDQSAAKIMRFKYTNGEKYRVRTEIDEDILINGVHSHRSNILNKVSVETTAVKGGAGQLDCLFQMSESIQGRFNAYFLKGDYRSYFWRDDRGSFSIDKDYFMPVIRNVPFFPERGVKPGDTWTFDAEEVHDLRRGYGIERAFHFPIKVIYTYLRDELKDGVQTAVLKIQYTAFHQVKYDGAQLNPVPVRITGASEQTFWWDIAQGKMHSCHEDFDFIFFLSNGSSVEYKGIAKSSLIPSQLFDKDKLVDEINRQIKDEKISETAARKDDKGVTIVLENVNFPPNSPELTDSERIKLERIVGILKKITNRDLLVTGHTARVGDEKTSQVLSEQRAMAVGDYLIGKGACKKNQLMTQGKGSREPVGENSTEEGRKRNRRVEITILEN